MKYLSVLSVVVFLAMSCGTKRGMVDKPVEIEYRDLDTLVVSAPKIDKEASYELPNYNRSATRINDLLHTKLDVRFDWDKEQVIGKAWLKMKPHFYETQYVMLDAKGFELKQVSASERGQEYKFEYNGSQLFIDLGRKYEKEETFDIYIDYVATPNQSGGSAAITSDKGLFFINPTGENKTKPQQIWTQGETENNSRWFPTIDKPNERCTQEIYVTVDQKYKTLSNGVKVSATNNSDGTRTDYWKMDEPHAPYLFMLTIGEFEVVEDKWDGKVVDYYVEKEYKDHARRIFPHTPEMLQFFSDKLGVNYPWPKYSQVVVRDYVSGAMENTSAVIFGEFMQGTERELVDNMTNDKIVAHEMFHHWFGDYVTCESWANLTMNEGFANYSEYLWLEHKYGKDAADYHWYQELQGYLQQAQNQIHPLIHYGHDDKEDMFDAHSYNKGGMVLHMLRDVVGDDAFFASLNKYLTDNRFSDVEAHELRLAFEDVTGQDLNWFFNQWYFEQGHPDLKYEWEYNGEAGELKLIVQQMQDAEKMPAIFELPIAVDIYGQDGSIYRQEFLTDQRRGAYIVEMESEPIFVDFDADKVLLATVEYKQRPEALEFQFMNTKTFMNRYTAMKELAGASAAVNEKGLGDDFWMIRAMAVDNVTLNEVTESVLAKLAVNDAHSVVRQNAIEKLASTKKPAYAQMAKTAIKNDVSDGVVGSALNALMLFDKTEALAQAKQLETSKSGAILSAVGELYADEGNVDNIGFYEQSWGKVDGFSVISFIENYTALVLKTDMSAQKAAVAKLQSLAVDMTQSPWRRFGATKAINDVHGLLTKQIADGKSVEQIEKLKVFDTEILKAIELIKSTEENGQLKALYGNFPDPK